MLDNPIRDRNLSAGYGPKASLWASEAAEPFGGFDPVAVYTQFWNQSGFKVSQEIAGSWLQFLGKRWAKDLAFQNMIAQCKTAEDFCAAYSEFLQQAAADYSAEFNDIANAGWAAARTSFRMADEPCGSNGCGNCGNKHS